METAKRQALTLIQNLPDDSTLEDIQYHLYVREKVERGLTDLKGRRTVSQRQAEERMQKWLKRSSGLKAPGLTWKPSLTSSPETRHYAASFVREIRNHARSLSRMSARGRIVPEIGDRQIRELFVQSHRLIYKVERSRVAILALVHGARDLEALWARKRN